MGGERREKRYTENARDSTRLLCFFFPVFFLNGVVVCCSLPSFIFFSKLVSFLFKFFIYLSESGYIRDGTAIGFNPQDLRARITRGSTFDHRASGVGKVDAVGWLL